MIVTSFHSHLYLLPQFLAKKMSTFMLPGQTHDSEKKLESKLYRSIL
ncbi:hypothetical protein LMANV2_100117 [Leptospira interrogans serovar Manilae]|uniref:Uncharacterized protein n=1 Tax=Leptospira interrogans serovar Manilae TaxID=214675 RepID=A0AAQ1SM15_LEPIR|nr:hypothetical protein LMANV2_100117 [Leptospira interrogans serovar Manilae]